MARRVVITGMGVVTELGTTLSEYWNGLVEGKSGVGPLTLRRVDVQGPFRRSGQRLGRRPPFGKKEARHLDRFAQFALVASQPAVESGIDFTKFLPDRCGVFIGSGIGGLNEFEEQYRTFLQRGPGGSARSPSRS